MRETVKNWTSCLCIAMAIWLGTVLTRNVRPAPTPPAVNLAQAQPVNAPLNPAAWGSDHVGQPVPQFVSGDECLFCHRDDVATTWSDNVHATTIRRATGQSPEVGALLAVTELAEAADEVEFILGHERRIRFLKRLPAYGKLSLLSFGWDPALPLSRQLIPATSKLKWNDQTFALRCAGCHASGVDPTDGSFAAISLDCFVCHGDTSLDHANDSSLVLLARKRQDEARVVTSICAQCHLRRGKSRSTGRPYANNFVAGDNLFRDLDVDFSTPKMAGLNPLDQHVLQNVRDVVMLDRKDMTCLSCHDVHQASTDKHIALREQEICLNCHYADRPKSDLKEFQVSNRLCEY